MLAATDSGIGALSVLLRVALLAPFMIVLNGLDGPRWSAVVTGVVLLALLPAPILGGKALWLTAAGSEPQSCELIDVQFHDNTRSADTQSYVFDRTGGEVEYRSYSASSPGTENGQLTLVTDRTGFARPLQPDEVTSFRRGAYVALLLCMLLLILLNWALPGREKPAKE